MPYYFYFSFSVSIQWLNLHRIFFWEVSAQFIRLISFSEPQEPDEQRTKRCRLDPFADLRYEASTSASSASGQNFKTSTIHDELARYKALKIPASSSDLLMYWKEQSTDYPILSMLARRLLCITASSAQSERDFSSVGRTITEARSLLSASKVEKIELVRCRDSFWISNSIYFRSSKYSWYSYSC